MEVGTLTPDTRIENEECVYCFNNYDDPEGINICLQCFTCCCTEHAKQHFQERQHGCFLSRKRITTVSKADPNKLAIGVEGGFEDVKHTYEFELRLFDEGGFQVLPDELADTEEAIKVIDQIKKAPSASCADLVQSWELQVVECPHVKGLVQPDEKIPPRPCKCTDCDLDKNLWLCLTCGHIGCGRRNFDGSGGNNHAVDHYNETKHPVVVKLGTISPDGRADLFCYQCDETVSDPNIAQHLAKYSIDVETAVKTESTTTELNVQINKNWDFDAVTADGREYETMKGPFSVGLENLGNTCYMNSILQTLARIQPFVDEFAIPGGNAEKARWTDPARQLHRLLKEMQQGDRSKVSPRILRQVVCAGNHQFLGGQQQDAVEFFQYLYNYLKLHFPATVLRDAEFDSVQVVQCTGCADQATIPLKDQIFLMLTPPHSPPDTPEVNIPIDYLLEMTLTQEMVERKCDKCQKAGAVSRTLFKNFPEYLFVAVALDTVTESGMVRKMNLNVEFDPNRLDLTKYRSDVDESVDEKKVAELMNFGFTRAQCVRALENVGSVEEAVDWIVEHPMEQSPAVASVMEMGFSENEAREALEESQGNVALAIEWLFGPRTKKQSAQRSDGEGIYEMIAFVQHKGPSALCGHYVANVKRDGKWILYNDAKAAIYPDDVPPQFGKGYFYLFQRKHE
ncbi:Clan CA, family C19, ubiquitin hydrolase-like cysteine peptidase [Tritrichomonas foetus]|uniref:ubiquitinyl hydrolase 1 n=1 Tax=Tritrichomonas foetus TaxID=1144522 RepID=A0A1J4K5I6_9EUKA|nr:Clan CA, family C19, ubiquitin hydrolase-like cysteine peptidase [Tritrichomonas foetus]|eukprot:OHT04733.1 Clan CA, family C19, ubiquitin hydrolase-like cysteine peptidase [Tritrichomonas foetus]